MPSVPRKTFIASVSCGLPARHCPTADSLSHTNAFGTRPQPEINIPCPTSRSGDCRDGIITADSHREYPDTITSTGDRPTCPNPNDTSAGGNHRSHCASSPGRYSVRWLRSGRRNNGRNCYTRSANTVLPRVHPTRSMITVVGMSGNSANNARICGSTASTIEPFAAR